MQSTRVGPQILAAVAIMLLAMSWRAWGDCPVSQMACGTVTPSPPVLTTECLPTDVTSGGTQSYDWPNGRIACSAGTGCLSGAATVDAYDSVTVTGGTPGSVIHITAVLNLYGSMMTTNLAGADAYFWIGAGSQTVESPHYTLFPNSGRFQSFSFARLTVSVRVTAIDGTPFLLRMGAGCGTSLNGCGAGSASASVGGQLTILDLPPGYVLLSCQGFSAGGATPARSESWGRVKIRYR